MRAHNGICLLRRHGSTIRPPLNAQKRFNSSNNCEPFVLPRLVIDLDAADSTLVKKWEDIIAEDKAGQDATSTRISRNQRGQEGRVRKPKEDRSGGIQKRFQIDSLTPCDVWSFAILGHPAAQQNSKSHILKNVCRRYGIQENDSDEVVFQHLAAGYSADISQPLTQAGFSQSSKEDLSRMVRTCGDFTKLKRTVTMLSSTIEGCRFLVQHEKSVLRGIKKCRRPDESASQTRMVSCSMILRMLNNVKISMESKGIGIGPGLCNAGIYYASMVPSLPAVRGYLKTSLLNSHPANIYTALGLIQLQHLYQTSREDSKGSLLPYASHKEHIHTLIIGSKECSGAWHMEHSDISFASLLFGEGGSSSGVEVDTRLYFTYIQGLGELGLSNTLWEEFKVGEPHLPSSLRSEKHRIYVARFFALTCVVAGDLKRAFSILESVQSFPEPEASDEGKTSLRHAHQKWLLSTIDAHYRYRALSPDKELRNKIKKGIHSLPRDPERTIDIFEQFIVRETMLHAEGATVPAGTLVHSQNQGQRGPLVESSLDADSSPSRRVQLEAGMGM